MAGHALHGPAHGKESGLADVQRVNLLDGYRRRRVEHDGGGCDRASPWTAPGFIDAAGEEKPLVHRASATRVALAIHPWLSFIAVSPNPCR